MKPLRPNLANGVVPYLMAHGVELNTYFHVKYRLDLNLSFVEREMRHIGNSLYETITRKNQKQNLD